ncbi:hypothetical protein BKA63DRAFT_71952 [Paraphoma chrysanthemicola]|nr:hypothetical protein BKA63DRAFT_71952 [Paraphoma chrysanthemicola]
MDAVIWAEYRKRYCNPSGVQYASLNLDRFRKSLLRDHPTRQADVDDSLRRFDLEVCEIICERFPTNEQGHFENPIAVRAALKDLRPDLSMDAVDGRLEKIVKQTVFRRVQPSSTQEVAESSSCPSILFQPNTTMAWVQSEYRQRYCDEDGMPNRSMNIDVLRDLLLKARPENSEEIKGAVKKLGIQICEVNLIKSTIPATF